MTRSYPKSARPWTEGITQGKETLVLRRLGSVPADLAARLDTLTSEQLDNLGKALPDFRTVADLQQWLDQHQPKIGR